MRKPTIDVKYLLHWCKIYRREFIPHKWNDEN